MKWNPFFALVKSVNQVFSSILLLKFVWDDQKEMWQNNEIIYLFLRINNGN